MIRVWSHVTLPLQPPTPLAPVSNSAGQTSGGRYLDLHLACSDIVFQMFSAYALR